MSEKTQSLPPVGGGAPPSARKAPPRYRIVEALVFLNLLVFCYTHASWFLSSPREHESPSRPSNGGQCAQVPALNPTAASDEGGRLDKMDRFLESEVFRNESVARVAGAVQIRSESYDDMGPVDQDPRWKPMGDLADYLRRTFPLIHKGDSVTLDKINTYGLLYTWHGSDDSLKPSVLMAHQDVVPVEQSTIEQWEHPPFSGHYDGRFIWGRGSGDCKNSLVGILEAIELLIDAGYKPKRTVLLSFGFDEEISGGRGAQSLSQAILDRYGKNGIASVVDEGAGVVKQWGKEFAVPGVAEKGYIDVEIIVRMPGGHSSVPPDHTGIGIVSELITLIEANPYEPRIHDENPFLTLLQCGAAHGEDFPKKLKKLLPGRHATSGKHSHKHKEDKLAKEAAKAGPLVKYLFTTSVAVDVISGGVKVNALPEQTRVLVNHRINVGSSSADVKDKMTRLAEKVAKKYGLTVHAFEPSGDDDEEAELRSITLRHSKAVLEPAPVSPTSVDGTTPYSILAGTTRALYGEDMIVAPGLMTGNTDTRYYWDLSDHIFRFAPGWDPDYDFWEGIHTVNEKLSVLAHIRTVQWYSKFIRNMDEADLD